MDQRGAREGGRGWRVNIAEFIDELKGHAAVLGEHAPVYSDSGSVVTKIKAGRVEVTLTGTDEATRSAMEAHSARESASRELRAIRMAAVALCSEMILAKPNKKKLTKLRFDLAELAILTT